MDIDDPDNPKCTPVCDDDNFDKYVLSAISKLQDERWYCVLATETGNLQFLGARNCQTWANEVLRIAREEYLANEDCPECFE